MKSRKAQPSVEAPEDTRAERPKQVRNTSGLEPYTKDDPRLKKPGKGKGRIISQEARHEHERLVAAALALGLSYANVGRQVSQAARNAGIPVSERHVINKVIPRVLAKWTEQDAKFSRSRKVQAIARAKEAVQFARDGRRVDGVWIARPNANAYIAALDHLARLEGTYEPFAISATFQRADALGAALNSMTSEQLEDCVKLADQFTSGAFSRALPVPVVEESAAE